MTEEEQKAIENIEKELNKKYEVVPLYKDFSINSPMNIVQKHYNDTDIKIILNLISKLQKENEELKNMSGIDVYKLGQKTQRDKTNFEIERLQKENEELKEKEKNLLLQLKDSEKELLEISQKLQKLQKELDKKDKVINYIAKHTYIRTGENGVLGTITEEVIEHLYKKAD